MGNVPPADDSSPQTMDHLPHLYLFSLNLTATYLDQVALRHGGWGQHLRYYLALESHHCQPYVSKTLWEYQLLSSGRILLRSPQNPQPSHPTGGGRKKPGAFCPWALQLSFLPLNLGLP